MKTFLLLSGFIFFLTCCQAQDSAFIEHYKNFRAATESYKSYSFLIKMDYPSKKLKLSGYSRVIEESFHFLRGKQLKNKKADCEIVLAVNELIIQRPPERKVIMGNNQSIHFITTNYSVSVDLEVYHKGKRMFSFPICRDTLMQKKYSYKIPFPKEPEMTSFNRGNTNDRSPLEDHTKSDKKNYEPGLEDIKDHMIAMIRLYKNYFIDRVDWNH